MGFTESDGFTYADKFVFVEIATNTAYKGERFRIESGVDVLKMVLAEINVSTDVVKGVPFLMYVDPNDSKRTLLNNTGVLEDNSDGEGHSPEKVRATLRKAYDSLRGN